MPIDFPSSPTVGQTYGFGGINYVFTAQGVWAITSTGAPATSTSAVTVQKFTASGTYTPTAGTQFIQVECIGGGGGGGGATATASATMQGGGGGGGGYSRSVFTAAQIGASQAITVGAGGTGTTGAGTAGTATSFGALCIANGGGGANAAVSGVASPGCGVGAAVGTGDVAIGGSPGGFGLYNSASLVTYALAGNGAPGPLGGGGNSLIGNPGPAANGYGAGGAGGSSHGVTTPIAGGAGFPGIVIITEYNIAAAGPQGPAGPMGGTTGVSAPGGRLTLNSTTPVMVTSNVGSPIIIYTPYIGDRIPIFDGANMVMTTFGPGAAVQCLLTDTSKNPGAIGASKVNDWYVWNDGGTVRLSHGPDWTSDTVRAPGTLAPVMINGILTNAVGITNGPTVNKGTYVGTTRSNATSTLDWTYGGLAALGSAGFFGVWNAYNRRPVGTTVADSTASWTYATVSTPRAANNSSNMRVYFVHGLAEDIFSARYYASTTGAVGIFAIIGIGLDSITVLAANASSGASVQTVTIMSEYISPSLLGTHYVQAMENTSGGTSTFFGNMGLKVNFWA